LGVENEALRGKLGEVDEKWLSESKNRIKLWWCKKEPVYFTKNEKTNTKIKSNISTWRSFCEKGPRLIILSVTDFCSPHIIQSIIVSSVNFWMKFYLLT
jgi:hypothetical protein